MSSGNSLFIAQRILHDPIPPDHLASCAVAHAIGNVGKPGIALLFAPNKPEVRKHDVEKWQVVNHNPFDGKPVGGTFEGSSLHMSFTGWEGPLRVRGPAAFRGMEAYNLETRISMYDKGEWVADLDVLKSLSSSPNLRDATAKTYLLTCGPNLATRTENTASHKTCVFGTGATFVEEEQAVTWSASAGIELIAAECTPYRRNMSAMCTLSMDVGADEEPSLQTGVIPIEDHYWVPVTIAPGAFVDAEPTATTTGGSAGPTETGTGSESNNETQTDTEVQPAGGVSSLSGVPTMIFGGAIVAIFGILL
ncbi:hypothetical protein BDV12DRAFT_204022 [Aspergillus spectabilis]